MKPIGPDWVLGLVLLVVVAVLIRFVIVARSTKLGGYRFGRDVYVRCREGHLFMTTWVPFVSFKAVRLGMVRLQHCPVGDHLTSVTLVRDEDLSDYEKLLAQRFRDNGVP